MNTSKIENLLDLSLEASPEERERSRALSEGFSREEDTWEIIFRYIGNTENLREKYDGISFTKLTDHYVIAEVTEAELVSLSMEPDVVYIEKPKRLYFAVDQGNRASCVPAVTAAGFPGGGLSGGGVLAAVIDSGIDYSHPDFRKEDGSSRIRFLWDQTLRAPVNNSVQPGNAGTGAGVETEPDNDRAGADVETELENDSVGLREEVQPGNAGTVPENFGFGLEYDQAALNLALSMPTMQERLRVCPSVDVSGHGTHVAGILAGNGRASEGRYRGVAYEAELIIVKLGNPRPDSFPRTTELMQAVEYCYRKAEELGMPMVVNLSFGNSYGSHDGNSLLETYLDTMASELQTVIVAGTGNEGAGKGHAAGNFRYDPVRGERLSRNVDIYRNREIEFSVGAYEASFGIQIWKSYSDRFDIVLMHPSGRTAGPLQEQLGVQRFTLEQTEILVYYGEPTPYSEYQEIYLDFIPKGDFVDTGIWMMMLIPQQIRNGKYDLWFPVQEALNLDTGFLYPVPDTTLTIPSTAYGLIAVGAYDAAYDKAAEFSGRGYTREELIIKPDLVAPGVGIISCAAGGGYTSKSGTSMAAPFVSGSAALLMQWGIVNGNDPYLYGEKVRAYLISGARQVTGLGEFPNQQAGWGALCVRDSIPR